MAFAATPAQRELWHLDRVAAAGAALNVPVAWRISGPLDEAALHTALRSMIRTHDALRASFHDRDGELMVDIGPVPRRCLDAEDVPADADPDQRLASFAAEPFDLAEGPLMRGLLLRLPGGDRLLALRFHHIAIDAWSLDLIEQDLGRSYRTASTAPTSTAPTEAAARRVNALRQHSSWRDDLDYWADRLRGVPAQIPIPGDARAASFGAQVFERPLAATTGRRLSALGRRLGMTSFQLLFAAYAGTIARWLNRNDFVLNVPVSSRGDGEAQATVLLLVHLLPIRVELTTDHAFSHLVDEVRQRLIEAIEHGSPTLSEIQRRCQSDAGGQLDGLSDLIVTYESYSGDGLELDGARCQRVPVVTATSLYRLACHIEQQGDDDIRIELRSRVLAAEDLASLWARLAAVLDAVAEDPMLPLSRWPVLLPGEPRVVAGHPTSDLARENIPRLFLDTSVDLPEAPAVEAGDAHLNYWQLRRRALGLAARIEAAGASQGEPVAVCISRGTSLVTAIHAVFLAGCVYLPLDRSWPPGRMRLILGDARARYVLCDETTADLPALSGMMKITTEPAGGGGVIPPDLPAGTHAAYLLYTSGSSGTPKGVLVEHAALGRLIASMRDVVHGTDVARVLACTAATFDIALVELLLPVALGATCVLADDETARDPMLLAELIASRRIDFVQATPTVWSALLEHLTVRIPVAVAAGEPLPGRLRDQMLAAADRAFNGYGPTEATIYSTIWPLEPGVPVSIGRPLPGTWAWVLDRWDQPCAPGVIGRLLLGGAGLARGYVEHDGEPMRNRFIDGLATLTSQRAYWSGDLASWSADGLLFLHGREDDQVKIRGNRVELGEIEAVAAGVEGVADVAAVAFSRGEHSHGLAAFVQPRHPTKDGFPVGLEQRIRAAFADNLPSAVRPRLIVPVSALPLLSSGKTDRKELARRAEAVPTVPDAPPADTDELLAKVAAAFAEALNLPWVDPQANFFGLGGDSITAARVVAKVRQRFGAALSLRAFLAGPTATDVASAIRGGVTGSQRGE